MFNFKHAGATVRGTGHIKTNLPCQDKIFSQYSSGVNCIALADGAGSCKHSDIGAEIITKNVSNYLCKNFDDIISLSENKIIDLISKFLDETLIIKSKELKIDKNELSATLLFVCVKNDQFLTGHVGDGMIGFKKESKIEVLSYPLTGEFTNATVFTTSENLPEYLRIVKGKTNNIDGFFLMSDGSMESLYDKEKNMLTKANQHFFDWMAQSETMDTVNKALYTNMNNLFLKKTSDDCSIIILNIYKVTNIIKMLKVYLTDKEWLNDYRYDTFFGEEEEE
jgi:serine/threonine protein phosphatase PrpC